MNLRSRLLFSNFCRFHCIYYIPINMKNLWRISSLFLKFGISFPISNKMRLCVSCIFLLLSSFIRHIILMKFISIRYYIGNKVMLYLQIIGICGIYNIEECGLRDRALIIIWYSQHSSSIYELEICGMRIKCTDNVRRCYGIL